MKFFWKSFFIYINLMMVVFSVFGLWLVSSTFRSSLEREREQAVTEYQMFQFAFSTMADGLAQVETDRQDQTVMEIADSVVNGLSRKNVFYAVYDGNGEKIYGSSAFMPAVLSIQDMDSHGNSRIVNRDGKYYIAVTGRSQETDPVYYLIGYKDISHIYEEREHLFETYRMVMLGLVAVTAAVTMVVTHFLTKPVVALSKAAKKIAEGDYTVRAKCRSRDELGQLAGDFNQMAERLSDHMNELSEAVRRQEDFTASFAHELKTPLTSVIGYADMLRRMDMTPEEIVEASNYIYTQGRRLESLSFKLLELITADKQHYEMREIPVKELMRALMPVVLPSLRERHIHLHISGKKGVIYGEKDLLLSLFINLIDNARKALDDGGHIWLQGQQEGKVYHFRVIDNGRGIPEEELDKITEAFYMVDKSRARKEGGAGIGMALCQKIITLHHASWKIESRPQEGTVISISFPMKEGSDETAE